MVLDGLGDGGLPGSVQGLIAARLDGLALDEKELVQKAAVVGRVFWTGSLTRPVEVLENGTNPVQECIYTVFEEEFWHNRYALRDLAQLEAAT
jgi:hypothetical protein